MLWYKVLLPYVTKFPNVLISADERIKIFRVDLFSRALQYFVELLFSFFPLRRITIALLITNGAQRSSKFHLSF